MLRVESKVSEEEALKLRATGLQPWKRIYVFSSGVIEHGSWNNCYAPVVITGE